MWSRLCILLAVCLAVRGIYWIYTRPVSIAKRPPAGWEELEPCSSLISFNGPTYLTLFEDQHAELLQYIPAENGKDATGRVTDGRWSYNASSARYSVTIGEDTTAYSLFSPEQLSICIMSKGEIGAADLYESWFTPRDDLDDYDPRDDRR